MEGTRSRYRIRHLLNPDKFVEYAREKFGVLLTQLLNQLLHAPLNSKYKHILVKHMFVLLNAWRLHVYFSQYIPQMVW